MKKKLLTVIGSTLLVLVLAALLIPGCAKEAPVAPAAPAPAKVLQWKSACAWSSEVDDVTTSVWSDLIGVYSGGRINVEFYPDGLLGSHDEMFRGVQEGSIAMADFAPYVNIVPGGMLNWMPWTVGNFDESALAYAAPDGILFKVMTEAWDEVGGHLVFCGAKGPYNISSRVSPLHSPADFKNWKFRVSGSKGFVMTMRNMSEGTGMTLETIPWADLYGALERGVVDGCWDCWVHLVEDRHMEVIKYYTVLEFGWDCENFVINKELWDGLPSDLKDAVNKAGGVAGCWYCEHSRRAEVGYKKTVAELSDVEVYYPTPEERDAFREKANMPAIWEELCDPWLDEHYPGQNMSTKILDELAKIRAVAGR